MKAHKDHDEHKSRVAGGSATNMRRGISRGYKQLSKTGKAKRKALIGNVAAPTETNNN